MGFKVSFVVKFFSTIIALPIQLRFFSAYINMTLQINFITKCFVAILTEMIRFIVLRKMRIVSKLYIAERTDFHFCEMTDDRL